MTTHGKLCRNCMAVEIPTRKTLCTECRDKLATERIETNKIYKRNKNRLKNPGKRYCQYKDCGKEIIYKGDMRVFLRTKYCEYHTIIVRKKQKSEYSANYNNQHRSERAEYIKNYYTRCGKRSRAKNAPKIGKSYIAPITGPEKAAIIMIKSGLTPDGNRQRCVELCKDGLPGKFIAI